eukprot:g3545.t1
MEESREPQFHCSLTGEILDDPVWGADGRAYERHALEAFLAAGEDAAAADTTTPEGEGAQSSADRALRNVLSRASPPFRPAVQLQTTIQKLLYLTERPFSEQVSEGVVDDLQKQLRRSYLERDTCIQVAKQVTEHNMLASKRRTAWQTKERLEGVEARLAEQENALEKQSAEIWRQRIAESKRHARIAAHNDTLDQLEQKVWLHLNESTRQRIREDRELYAIRQQVASLEETVEQLKRINITNEAFHIWHEGNFGIINGFRLGRLGSEVEWPEVNAAWGQAALLLATIANKVGFTFSKFRIIPMGSNSKIAKVGQERTSYDLHSTSGGMFGSFRSTFNAGMAAYLACLTEIGDYAMSVDRALRLPYDMSSVSIRTSGQSEDQWTKALKYMLTNLKWLQYWSFKKNK